MWNYRRILALLVRRDLKVRYAGSFLGYLWSVLDPLLMSLVFWFIFTQIFHRTVGYPPYILFLVMGQMIMSWFQSGVTATREGAAVRSADGALEQRARANCGSYASRCPRASSTSTACRSS